MGLIFRLVCRAFGAKFSLLEARNLLPPGAVGAKFPSRARERKRYRAAAPRKTLTFTGPFGETLPLASPPKAAHPLKRIRNYALDTPAAGD